MRRVRRPAGNESKARPLARDRDTGEDGLVVVVWDAIGGEKSFTTSANRRKDHMPQHVAPSPCCRKIQLKHSIFFEVDILIYQFKHESKALNWINACVLACPATAQRSTANGWLISNS